MTLNVVRSVVLLAVVAVPSSAMAQNANPLTANAKVQFGALSGFVVRSAEKVPEDLYSFRATPEVRMGRGSESGRDCRYKCLQINGRPDDCKDDFI